MGLMGQTSLIGMNGFRNLISALLTTIAVVINVAGDIIANEHLLVLRVAAIFGGYAGATLAYHIPQHVLRALIVAVGLLMSFSFFLT